MPNLRIGENGTLDIEVMTGIAALEPDLLDEDGAALMVHEGSDDDKSDPAGGAGSPIACGVIESFGQEAARLTGRSLLPTLPR